VSRWDEWLPNLWGPWQAEAWRLQGGYDHATVSLNDPALRPQLEGLINGLIAAIPLKISPPPPPLTPPPMPSPLLSPSHAVRPPEPANRSLCSSWPWCGDVSSFPLSPPAPRVPLAPPEPPPGLGPRPVLLTGSWAVLVLGLVASGLMGVFTCCVTLSCEHVVRRSKRSWGTAPTFRSVIRPTKLARECPDDLPADDAHAHDDHVQAEPATVLGGLPAAHSRPADDPQGSARSEVSSTSVTRCLTSTPAVSFLSPNNPASAGGA
jgi:hypothetical protein